ncbi:MAG: HU family DNA-binding protein [Prolixibacteraceae bacterium]|nr:HU family DNA-binding protein [Prolixibacteraceae bacterium]MBN2773433.1 HU family DNA-binding protein [Prolixibacteraceae bacterium]
MKNFDYLIWIGDSYSRVLCQSSKTCAIPFKKKPPHCFIHEAEWRGCCRKVPQIPRFAVPGKTRIFLAHRDGLKAKEHGRIFGYYILDSIEIIKGVKNSMLLPLQNFRESKIGDKKVTAQCWDGSRIESKKIINIHSPLLEACPECMDGETKTKKCDNGEYIVTHECKDGEWIKTDNKCEEEFFDCKEFPFKFEECDEGFRLSEICIAGEWIQINSKCPERNSPEQTMFETERACSLRLVPGSVYFVDALTSAITKSFHENLNKEKFLEAYLNAESENEKEAIILKGRDLFIKTILKVKKDRKPTTEIPPEIADHAELRGEFVLFKNNAVFEKYPQASFKGIMRIDGDMIIEQIAQGTNRINITYCDEDWVSHLADIMRTNKNYVNRFLKTFISVIKRELKNNNEFKLPGFGKLEVYLSQPTTAFNPKTGKKEVVLPKKRIRFKKYKNLKEFDKTEKQSKNNLGGTESQ